MDGQTSGALYFAQKFMAAGREEDASAVREQLAGVRKAATALRDSPDAVPENRALAEEVLGRVDGLDTGFGRVAQLRQAAFMLFRESLEPAGKEIDRKSTRRKSSKQCAHQMPASGRKKQH